MADILDPMREIDITRLWRARRTVLEMLFDRGYAVLNNDEDMNQSLQFFTDDFKSKGYNREQISILRQKREDPAQQIWVFFPEEKRGKAVGISVITEKVKQLEATNVQAAIFVLQTGLTTFAKNTIDKVSISANCTIETFNENELLVNITHHVLVPRHELMSIDQKKALLRRYRLKESQLPRIQKGDPVARYYGLRHGDVVKITRPSETAGRYVTYRLCVG